MEMFDVHRRDVHTFDRYMDLKQPGFGGPSSAEQMYTESKGTVKRVNKDPKLKEFQRTAHRPVQNNQFTHEVFNPTYKAMGGDLVHKQEVGKNPYDYPDLYNNMGIATVERGDKTVGKPNHGDIHLHEGVIPSFSEFVNESFDDEGCDCGPDCNCNERNPFAADHDIEIDIEYKDGRDERVVVLTQNGVSVHIPEDKVDHVMSEIMGRLDASPRPGNDMEGFGEWPSDEPWGNGEGLDMPGM